MKKLANDPVIIAFARTPLGRYGGVLSHTRPDDMLAHLMTNLVKKTNIDAGHIEEVVIGCANQAGEDNRNIARMASLLAGFPVSVAGITVNRLCASGLDAVISAARRIIIGEQELVMAGGVESMSRAPLVMAKPDAAFKLGAPAVFDSSLGWRFFNEKMRERTAPESNGLTAENLVRKFNISRLKQDEFALNSHKKAIAAQLRGDFVREIIPMQTDKDEGPRDDCTLEKLSKLAPAFMANGHVTAGNSSPLSDGAAVMLLASMDFAKRHALTPLARIRGFASVGVSPQEMGLGPVFSTNKLLAKHGFALNDFDTFEINEAFAAQVLSVIEVLKIDENKVNPYGGALALGHPLGCSGARIVCTLINSLSQSGKNLGLATLCVGVGQGVSMALEVV